MDGLCVEENNNIVPNKQHVIQFRENFEIKTLIPICNFKFVVNYKYLEPIDL